MFVSRAGKLNTAKNLTFGDKKVVLVADPNKQYTDEMSKALESLVKKCLLLGDTFEIRTANSLLDVEKALPVSHVLVTGGKANGRDSVAKKAVKKGGLSPKSVLSLESTNNLANKGFENIFTGALYSTKRH
jgi:hypothetical protein